MVKVKCIKCQEWDDLDTKGIDIHICIFCKSFPILLGEPWEGIELRCRCEFPFTICTESYPPSEFLDMIKEWNKFAQMKRELYDKNEPNQDVCGD